MKTLKILQGKKKTKKKKNTKIVLPCANSEVCWNTPVVAGQAHAIRPTRESCQGRLRTLSPWTPGHSLVVFRQSRWIQLEIGKMVVARAAALIPEKQRTGPREQVQQEDDVLLPAPNPQSWERSQPRMIQPS